MNIELNTNYSNLMKSKKYPFKSEEEYRAALCASLKDIKTLLKAIKEHGFKEDLKTLPDLKSNLDKYEGLSILMASLEDVGACFSYITYINDMQEFKQQLIYIIKAHKLTNILAYGWQ